MSRARIGRSSLFVTAVLMSSLLLAASPVGAATPPGVGSPGENNGVLSIPAVPKGAETAFEVELRSGSGTFQRASASLGLTAGFRLVPRLSLPLGAKITGASIVDGGPGQCFFGSLWATCVVGAIGPDQTRRVRFIVDTPGNRNSLAMWVAGRFFTNKNWGDDDRRVIKKFADGSFDFLPAGASGGWVPEGGTIDFATTGGGDLASAIFAPVGGTVATIFDDEDDDECVSEGLPEGSECYLGASVISAFGGAEIPGGGGLQVTLTYQLPSEYCEYYYCGDSEVSPYGMIHFFDDNGEEDGGSQVLREGPDDCSEERTVDCINQVIVSEDYLTVTIIATWSTNGKGKGFG